MCSAPRRLGKLARTAISCGAGSGPCPNRRKYLGETSRTTKLESRDELVDRAVGVLLRLAGAWKQKQLHHGRVGDEAGVSVLRRGRFCLRRAERAPDALRVGTSEEIKAGAASRRAAMSSDELAGLLAVIAQ